MNKELLRKKYLKARKQFSKEQLETINRQLKTQLFNELISEPGLIHVFLPIKEKQEIDTWPMLPILWERGWQTCTSITHFDDNRLSHTRIDAKTNFVENKWGVPEPTNQQSVLPIEIDVVLIPMLCFDLKGHRVGYGKGYYDRFLSECRTEVTKIGLCMADPINEITDASAHDITMDVCITPLKVYKFE